MRLSELLPRSDKPSIYAAEGTAAHELAEITTNYALGKLTTRQRTAQMKKWRMLHKDFVSNEKEMQQHADEYRELILSKQQDFPLTEVLLEQRVRPGIESCWGTSDAVLISPEHVEIVDFKYGSGVAVDALENTQLMLYGVGALEMFGGILGDPRIVRMTIHQPRLNSVSTYEMEADALRAWRDSIIPIARDALSGQSQTFGPSLEACRWCPVSGQCRARLDKFAGEDFSSSPDLLSPEELADALELIPEIAQWSEAVKAFALDKAYSQGEPIPRHKVVRSNGRRVVSDETGLLSALEEAGFNREDFVTTGVKGLGEMEKLAGKKAFTVISEPYLTKVEGKPSLVHETDKRNAITPASSAAEDFAADAE